MIFSVNKQFVLIFFYFYILNNFSNLLARKFYLISKWVRCKYEAFTRYKILAITLSGAI